MASTKQQPTATDLMGMSEDQLKALAAERNLTVTGIGGGAPTYEDYVKALTPANPVAEQRNIATSKAAKLDSAPVGGRYINAQGKFVNANGQEIDAKTGKPVDGLPTKLNTEPMV